MCVKSYTFVFEGFINGCAHISHVRNILTHSKSVIIMKRERLPKGSMEIIELLEENGALTQKEIIETFKQKNPRAIRYTVRQLLDRAFLVNRANFEDMRSLLIGINPELSLRQKDLITQQKERYPIMSFV